ncbi:YeeE/YedE family protein [Tardiphaga robiniae]|uniref:YeeE/YedE family protein n=1 Tax=Tardiphaga robiniae TaxID=943830 RepID=UPI001FCED81E|nr:YeeE/YedE family protein [Tardiphaga robiniae]
MNDGTSVEALTGSPRHNEQAPGIDPALAAFAGRKLAVTVALAIVLALGVSAYALHGQGSPALAISLLFGAAFGIVLQRSRFCFFCMFREWFDDRAPQGILGLVVALAVGLIGTTLVFGAWLPDAGTGRLPPDAFIGPVSVALAAAGIAFGAGMAISGSCVSAHLYRLGEGSPTAPFALLGTVIGFVLGFVSWNTIYTAAVADAPVVWLPRTLGYAGHLLVAGAVLGLIAYAVTRSSPRKPVEQARPRDQVTAVFIDRWPAWIGGAIIGVLATMSYLRVAPLGVTAELGSRARQLAGALELAPTRLQGLDSLRGCIAVVRDALLSPNGAFVLGVVAASLAAALVAGQFKPQRPRIDHVLRGLTGGVLLGWGAMTGLGCTVGTLFSGVTAGALSGWVFGASLFTGTAVTLWSGRRLGLLPRG